MVQKMGDAIEKHMPVLWKIEMFIAHYNLSSLNFFQLKCDLALKFSVF